MWMPLDSYPSGYAALAPRPAMSERVIARVERQVGGWSSDRLPIAQADVRWAVCPLAGCEKDEVASVRSKWSAMRDRVVIPRIAGMSTDARRKKFSSVCNALHRRVRPR